MDFLYFVAAGFIAQLIDGSLGMAYGVSCTSMLLAFGFPPAAASASVHTAEIVTSGLSGHFHWRFGNVDPQLFRSLVWGGVVGGAVGAFVLSNAPGDRLRPWIAVYLIAMGVRILYKALGRVPPVTRPSAGLPWLGFVGGLCDAIGGGGWGPIVTSTLVGRGNDPRLAIGSVNRAEFFVTLVQAMTFAAFLGLTHLDVVIALSLGGALAAPAAAYAVRHIQPRPLMLAIGIVIVAISGWTLIDAL